MWLVDILIRLFLQTGQESKQRAADLTVVASLEHGSLLQSELSCYNMGWSFHGPFGPHSHDNMIFHAQHVFKKNG